MIRKRGDEKGKWLMVGMGGVGGLLGGINKGGI